MSLLDFLESPGARLGMGLLAAAGPRPLAQSGLGDRMMSVMDGLDKRKERESELEQRKQAFAMRQMQMEEAKASMLDRQRKQATDEAMRNAAQGAFRSPEMANAMSQGPMPGGGSMPTVRPGFDSEKFLSSAYGIDPMAAMGFAKTMEKEKPQLITVQTPNGPQQRWVRPGETNGVDVGAPPDKEAPLPWYVKKGVNGLTLDPVYSAFEKAKASFGRPPAQPMAPVAYINDKGQTVWGTITDARGQQAANFSPAVQGQLSGARAKGAQVGTGEGEAEVKLKNAELALPGLEQVVADLSALGKKATYTTFGQVADATRRQAGMPVGEGAIARKEYIAMVDNEVLPLLRSTFGAAFTEPEGRSLKATLGDPNASPEEKDAVLRSFIKTKRSQIQTMKGSQAADPVQKSFAMLPPANQYSGKRMESGDGTIYKSNGKTWVKE